MRVLENEASVDQPAYCREVGLVLVKWCHCVRHTILPAMSDQGSDDDQVAQRRDPLLLRLLKTPPQSRAEPLEVVRRAKRVEAYSDSSGTGERKEKAGPACAEPAPSRSGTSL
jgi:hypothetical protein